MKKRLLTAWIIACMFICLVGQTPIVALADGDDTRVISVPEGIQELLINEAPEIQTEQIEETTEESIEVQNDETDEVVSEQTDEVNENNEVITEQSEDTNTADETQTEEANDTNETQTEQGDFVTGIDEAPIAQNEEPAVPEVIPEVVPETPAEVQVTPDTNTVVEIPECIEQTVDALLPQGAHNFGDVVRVSGLLPKDAIVEAIPVNVEIEGQSVLLAYDITIYENEEKKNAGISWQPDENGLSVEFISTALEETEEEVNIWHMEDVEEAPEYVTAAPSPDGSVEFVAESFSVYVVTETKLTATIVASDGNTYEINVTYDNKSGIPMDGTALKVDELKPGDDGYDEYIEESALKVGVKAENLEFSKVFDIKIVDENDETIEYEPTGDVDVSIRVIGVSLSDYPQVNVLHFVEQRNAESYLIYDVNSTVKEEAVEFTTDSFSVYVVIGHEGGDVVNPRVEFHFINHLGVTEVTDSSGIYYIGDRYPFKNKGDIPGTNPVVNYTQYTQILKDGDSLEMIADPANEGMQYFYGWDVVDPMVISGTTDDYGVGSSGDKLYYTWPANPNRISFESPITISDSNVAIGDSVSWSLDGVSGSGIVDEDGNVHVFLAPVFDNYHFVNFMLRPFGSASNNLMSRKLIASGSASDTEVKISDIRSNSTDPVHLVFTGWEYIDSATNTRLTKQTVDYSGAPLTDSGRDGVYMTVNLNGGDDVDLYPIFVEARWVDFLAGVSGSGAKYVPSRFLEAWGRATETAPPSDEEGKNVFTQLETSTRAGYNFDGWYAFANVNPVTGEITNISNEEDVEVSYLTISGDTYTSHTVTVRTTAVKVSNADGSIVDSGTWSISSSGALVPGVSDYKLFDTSNGLRFYDPLDRLKLTANWVSDESQITVVYWTENAHIEGYTIPANEKDDYTAGAVKVITTSELNSNLTGTYNSGSTLSLSELEGYEESTIGILTRDYLDDIGAVPIGEEKFYDLNTTLSDASVTIKGDGSTIYNVYFSRKTFKIVFHIGRDNRVKNGGHQKTDEMWDGNWIEFMYKDAKVTELGYPTPGAPGRSPSNSINGVYSMTYIPTGQTVDSSYVTTNANVMGNYVPADGENLYIIEDKYGAYIGDRWPTQYNTNFEFGAPSGSTKCMYIWAAYYGSLYCRIANERSTAGNVQGANPDINGVYEYMSAELCSNRAGDEIINPEQVHHLVAWFGDTTNNDRFKRYHFLYEAIPGTYDSGSTILSGDSYSGYSQTTWALEHSAGDKREIIGHEFIEVKVENLLSNLQPQFQLSDSVDGYEQVYSCYNGSKVNGAYDIYFFYRPKTYTVTFNLGSSTKVDTYYYKQSLADADKYTGDVDVPEGYYFAGWYTNAEGYGNPFDFANEKMPSQNVVLYSVLKPLNYVVKIDPNGGELDHRTNLSVSTYFNTNYGTQVGEYSVERTFIKLTDKELDPSNLTDYYTGTKYYYINTQRTEDSSEGLWGIPQDLRNAVYVDEDGLDAYYNWYVTIMTDADLNYWEGARILTRQEFENLYTDYPYRPMGSGEHYTFMGWYEVDSNGSVASMPFNFNDPVKGDLELRAMWRLDGGYYIQYNPYFFAEEGGVVTAVVGEMENNTWTDPADSSKELYADQSSTLVLRAPTNITPGWVFRGWRVVRQDGTRTFTDSSGEHTYPYWESFKDTNYYQPGETFIIDSGLVSDYSVNGKIIHMQAWYEREDSSYRRPDVTNLTIDSNDAYYYGYINTIHDSDLPELKGPGHQGINNTDHLFAADKPTQIEIGDVQSNIAVHLNEYRHLFTNNNGYFLLGFDENEDPENPTTGKAFIPAYAADSVIAVTRDSDDTIYALWEPMVYATFVNDTALPLTITLSGSGTETISIVNEATGEFDREQRTNEITVQPNSQVKVVLPGAVPGTDTITAVTTNNHKSFKLKANGVLGTNDPYGTVYPEEALLGRTLTYTGTLETDPVGIVVTYTEEEERIVTYDVNGGTWTEPDTSATGSFIPSNTDTDVYTLDKVVYEVINRYKPSNPTPKNNNRIFLGWTTNPDIAAHNDFSGTAAVTWGQTTITPGEGENILDVVKRTYLWDFEEDPPYGETLYAVYSNKVTVTFNIVYDGTKLHNWGGPDTTDTDKPYTYYRSSADSQNITYTMAKGDRVPKPSDPEPNSDNPNWAFITWLKNNGNTSALPKTPKTPPTQIEDSYKSHIFDFSSHVTSNVELITSWTTVKPQYFIFTVENRVPDGSNDEEFTYNISIDELVYGKHGNNGSNSIDVSDIRWGTFTTTLKNNEKYTVFVKVLKSTKFDPNTFSVEISVIDEDGNTLKYGQLIYCNKNSNKNFVSDYRYTLSITQEEKNGYKTTVDTDNIVGSFALDSYNTVDSTNTFTFMAKTHGTTNPNAPYVNECIAAFSPTTNGFVEDQTNTMTVIFTNERPPVAPTNYETNYRPFFMMFGFGAILVGLIAGPVVMLRRRKEEEE